MIRPPFDDPGVVARLSGSFVENGFLLLPAVCEAVAPEVEFKPFFVPTRGRYDVAELPPDPALHRFAEAVSGLKLRARPSRLLRLSHRAYSLFYDDSLTRVSDGVELTLDLSESGGGPPVVYQSSDTEKLEVPQLPGLLAAVRRTEATWRYDRYLPFTVGDLRVLRLRATFQRAD